MLRYKPSRPKIRRGFGPTEGKVTYIHAREQWDELILSAGLPRKTIHLIRPILIVILRRSAEADGVPLPSADVIEV